MKIGQSADKPVVLPASSERPASAEAGRSQSTGGSRATPEASATIALSTTASTMLSSSNAIDDGSFDAAKVQRISQAIAEGKFTINAEAIADKLIANAQEMVSKVSTH